MSKKFLSEVGIANVIAEPKQSKFSIYEIIGSRRLDLVRALIGRGLFVPDPEDIGNFPVHTAIAAGDNFILQALINAVRDELKLYKNFRGENALHFAARIGSSSAVSILLDSEFDINEKMDDGRTAMMLACSSGSFGTVKALARRGHVDYSMQDLHGKTCWHYAIEDFILRKNCSKYMRSDGYGNKSVAYLINPEILEILKFLSSYAKYALGIKGAEVDFPSDIPLDILYIGEVHRVFRGMEKNYGVRFNHSDRKVASHSIAEKVVVVSCEKLLSSSDRKIVSSSKTEKVVVVSEAVGDVSGSMETCLAGEYDDTGSPGCVVS